MVYIVTDSPYSDVLSRQSEVDVTVYDRREETFLGHVRLSLNLSEQNPVLERFYPLTPRGPQDENVTGEIHIRMEFSKTEKKQYGPNDFKIMRLVGKGKDSCRWPSCDAN